MTANYWDNLSPYMIKEKSGWERERGTGKVFLGIMTLSVPQATVESLRSSFQANLASYWPGMVGGVDAGSSGDPCIDDYEMKRDQPGRPGWSEITLYYRKPKLIGQLDTALKCLLYVDIKGVATKKLRVNTGTDENPVWKTVEGPEQNPVVGDDFITVWRIVSGSNEILEPEFNIKMIVAYDTIPFDMLYRTVGKYHIYTASFGGAFNPEIQAKKLMFRSSVVATDVNRHGKWIVSHYFETSDVAYDVKVVTHADIKRVVEVPLKRLGGAGFEATGQKSRLIAWEPRGADVEVDIHRGGKDFGAPDGILDGLTYLNAT